MSSLTQPERLSALARTELMDSRPEEAFDRLTRLARRVLDVPVTLVSLIDGEREFFKSASGTALTGAPLSHSFCQFVVRDDAPVLVEDARSDPRVRESPAVEALGVRAYLGVPLRDPDDHVLGAFCVVDQTPRRWTEDDLQALHELAAAAETEIALRAATRRLATTEAAQEALRDSERRFRSIAANVPGMVYRFTMSPTGEFAMPYVSEASRELVSIDPEELMADVNPALEAVHPDDRDGYVNSVLDSAARFTRWDWRGRVIVGDEVRYVHGTSHPNREPDGTAVWDGVMVDETEVHEAQAREAQARQRFDLALDRAPIGMIIMSLDGHFLRANEALVQMTGYSAEELAARAPFPTVHPDDLQAVRDRFAELGRGHDTTSIEHRAIDASGAILWVLSRVTVIRDAQGRALHLLAQVQDISERRRYEARLRFMADHDPLTGLMNRRAFEVALESHLAHVRRYGPTGSLLVLDLDGFKFINDTLGHAVGDELIITCAAALTARMRESDIVARLGGDEFAILLPRGSEDEAKTVAQAAIDAVREHSRALTGAHVTQITASVGVAPFEAGVLTADEMLVNADLAMYDAKEAGKDRYTVYGAGGHAVPRIKAHMSWLERIRRALADDRYVLYAQPLIDIETSETAGYEVLVRMLGEDGSLIAPGTFLYIAERFGVIGELDRWIVSRAIRAMADHRRAGRPLALAVNISGLSAGDPALLQTIADELTAGDVPPANLTLEITETAAVADIPRARRFADALAAIGCQVALDDFGAGFGSFYYLKHLPFDRLKIDGEFVRQATANPADRLIIKAVTDIARGLGKQTVAECVPNADTVGLLRELGVDLGQGYFLGRPQPLDQLSATTRG